MNRSILNFLRDLVDKEEDWEEHLQLLLYLYRTTKHGSLSPYDILIGSNLPPLNIPTSGAISHLDPSGYSSILQGKLLELRELAESNTVEAANRQKQSHGGSEFLALQVGQEVLSNNSTRSRLEPHWTGPWL